MKITKASTNVKCGTSGKTECNSRYSKAEKYIKSSMKSYQSLKMMTLRKIVSQI